MKHLKIFALALACAFILTYTATVVSKPVEISNFQNATVREVVTSETGSCVIIFMSDEDEIPVTEDDAEKCKTYKPGDTMPF